jgi:hypothetical protein
MRVFDASDPGSLVNIFQGDLATGEGIAFHLAVLGDRLVDCSTSTLRFWDLSDLMNPSKLWEETLPETGRGCVLDGDRLFIPGHVLRVGEGGSNGLFQYDNTIDAGDGFPYNGASDDYFIYLAGSSGVEVISR